MYPYVRWLKVVLRNALRRRPLDVLEESVLHFRVWPGDLDFFGHMNNGRFLTLMDSGRFDFMGRLGLVGPMYRRKWMSVLGGARIEFRKPLRPFQRFELRTRLVGWDEKWFYLEQSFHVDGVEAARSLVRGLFRSGEGNIPTANVFAVIGSNAVSPPLPEAVARWRAELERTRRV